MMYVGRYLLGQLPPWQDKDILGIGGVDVRLFYLFTPSSSMLAMVRRPLSSYTLYYRDVIIKVDFMGVRLSLIEVCMSPHLIIP